MEFHWELSRLVIMAILGYGASIAISTIASIGIDWSGPPHLLPEFYPKRFNWRKFLLLLVAWVIVVNIVTLFTTNIDLRRYASATPICTGVSITDLLLVSECGE